MRLTTRLDHADISLGDDAPTVSVTRTETYRTHFANDVEVNGQQQLTIWTDHDGSNARTETLISAESVNVTHITEEDRSDGGEAFVTIEFASERQGLRRRVQGFIDEEDARKLRDALVALDLSDRETGEA